jgi:6-phosphofructokinase
MKSDAFHPPGGRLDRPGQFRYHRGMFDFKNHKKVAILFSGGPAPSANAVISSVALNFINARVPIIGFFFGFEFLEDFDRKNRFSLSPHVHYEVLDAGISRIRNQRGVFLKTSRANPGRLIQSPADLLDPEKNRRLVHILEALESLDVGCLITIGGDDTLKTANFLSRLGLPVIHIPKTIDNDYYGIAWTFGYWSSVQASQEALLNLRADAESTGSYFIVELMGRKAGWLTYAAGIAGEAVMMISNEDIEGEELDIDQLSARIVDTILLREKNSKYYGVICVAEGLADRLPEKYRPTEKDRHGNIILDAELPAHQLRRRAGQHAGLRRLQAVSKQAVRFHGLGLGQLLHRRRTFRSAHRPADPPHPPAQRAARQRFFRIEGGPFLQAHRVERGAGFAAHGGGKRPRRVPEAESPLIICTAPSAGSLPGWAFSRTSACPRGRSWRPARPVPIWSGGTGQWK